MPPDPQAMERMMQADWYFDYLSPYPYLQLARFGELEGKVAIRPRPVVFGKLLDHWGQKGPAEIPAKARQTYRITRWMAERRGLPFAGPPRHPFNPLPLLRLTIALGSSLDAVRAIYAHVWGAGQDAQDEGSLDALAGSLGMPDWRERIADPQVKAALHANTADAVAAGVFGVPSFVCAGELFWGEDATDLFLAFLADPGMFARPPYQRSLVVQPAAWRKGVERFEG